MNTVIGSVKFRPDGTGIVPQALLQWINGKQELVWRRTPPPRRSPSPRRLRQALGADARLPGGGRVEWQDAPDAAIETADDALVRPLAVAACDLDVALLRGLIPFQGPFPIGHEFVARSWRWAPR